MKFAVNFVRRYSTVFPRGKVLLQDDMSVTHGQLLETTLGPHLPRIERLLNKGDAVPCGSHLVYFNHAVAEPVLGADGYDNLQAPRSESPLIRRWVSGSVTFNLSEPLKLGSSAFCEEYVKNVEDSSKTKSSEKISVSIEREIRQSPNTNWSIKEIRTLLYVTDSDRVKAGMKRLLSRPKTDEGNETPLITQKIKCTDILLFRYSALSFNAHRLHYDPEYAKNNEGLPNTIAQGPLMVTLALRWTDANILPPGVSVYQLTYEVLGSISANEEVELCSSQSDKSSTHYTVQIKKEDGSVVFKGELETSRKPAN